MKYISRAFDLKYGIQASKDKLVVAKLYKNDKNDKNLTDLRHLCMSRETYQSTLVH